mgnify:CR=1 FL=1
MYYVFERGMDREADGAWGRGRDSTRNESGLERERDEYDVTARDATIWVYARGEWIEAPGDYFLCVWCLC